MAVMGSYRARSPRVKDGSVAQGGIDFGPPSAFNRIGGEERNAREIAVHSQAM